MRRRNRHRCAPNRPRPWQRPADTAGGRRAARARLLPPRGPPKPTTAGGYVLPGADPGIAFSEQQIFKLFQYDLAEDVVRCERTGLGLVNSLIGGNLREESRLGPVFRPPRRNGTAISTCCRAEFPTHGNREEESGNRDSIPQVSGIRPGTAHAGQSITPSGCPEPSGAKCTPGESRAKAVDVCFEISGIGPATGSGTI